MSETWIQVVTIIASLGGLMYFLIQRMDRDIIALSGQVDKIGSRLDAHAQRIDQLYRVIVDMLKEKK